jgi:hypothetical protein
MSSRSIVSEASTILGPEKEHALGERMRSIVDAFRTRAQRVKRRLEQPPTPSADFSEEEQGGNAAALSPKLVLDDFKDSLYASKSTIDFGDSLEERWRSLLNQLEYIDPRGYVNIGRLSAIGWDKSLTRFLAGGIWEGNARSMCILDRTQGDVSSS